MVSAASPAPRPRWHKAFLALLPAILRHAKVAFAYILPEPQVLQPRVNHERTRTWAVDRLVWLPWHADQDRLRDAVMTEAQKLVAQTASSVGNIQQAKLTAETVLKGLYAEVGWNVAVTWTTPSSEGPKAVAAQ